ncbi:hypothetical protein BGZ70_006464 [Mortierella alpina]|uniref:F-box domain-containing protein n=1 Tax=Mortierella alpina TaxID=64518 RepID=A0A9P6J7W8_MORAP|nr:hypothetical protein BGZ70_006464 [Mortierella alpina]
MDPFAIFPPELHRLTVQHLDRKTIVACALVNRNWYRLFCPSVWETVAIATPSQFEAFEASVNSGALSLHGHLISTLKTENYGVVEMLVANGAAACTNLTQLDVAFKRLRKDRTNGMQLPLSQIFSALPASVDHLRLDGNISFILSNNDEAWDELYEQDLASAIRETDDGPRSDLPTLKLRKLELLELVQGGVFLLETLKRSPLLERLAFDDALYALYLGGNEELSDILRDHCPALTTLRMDLEFMEDEFQARLVEGASTKGWKHLAFSGEGFGPLTEAAIMKHIGSLESVHLEIGLGFPSSAIQMLFSSAPNLKSFRKVCPSFAVADVRLDATDMIQSPWVCHSLEELQASISGVPRPDLTARTNGRPLTGPLHEGMSMEPSYTVQRQVYAQLGKLTKLRELVLSVSLESARQRHAEDLSDYEYEAEGVYYDPSLSQVERQYECLSFTLESGLDLLRDLKQLQVIDLSNMEVGIDGEAEQRWVKKHWPLVRQA